MLPRIDTHVHFLPPFYREALEQNGHEHPDGMPAIPEWSEEAHLALMDSLNITTSILSISSPGVHLTPTTPAASAAALARRCNAFAADLKRKHPSRFGFWASLPLPAVSESLAEIETADNDGADGFCLLTNHHGHYLGDALFDPVFEELDRRGAKVFIHPTMPCVACSSQHGAQSSSSASSSPNRAHKIPATPLAPTYPSPMFEFFFDTARAVTNLFLSGTMSRYPNVTFVIPHAGGCLPPILSRFAGYSALVPGQNYHSFSEAEVRQMLNRRCYFDLAGWAFPGQIWGLVKGCGVGVDRLLYGSDYPFTSRKGVEGFAEVMDRAAGEMWGREEVRGVYAGNARRLLGLEDANEGEGERVEDEGDAGGKR